MKAIRPAFLLLLSGAAIFSSCNLFRKKPVTPGPVVPVTAETEWNSGPELSPITQLVYKVQNGDKSHVLYLEIMDTDNGIAMNYSKVQGSERGNGHVRISADAMASSARLAGSLSGDTLQLNDRSAAWVSAKTMAELKDQKKTTLTLDDNRVAELKKVKPGDTAQAIRVLVDGVITSLECVIAEASTDKGPARFHILKNSQHPLILRQETGTVMTLMEINHGMSAPAPFKIETGTVLYAQYKEFGCATYNVAYHVTEATAESMTIRADIHYSPCLADFEEADYTITYVLGTNAVNNPDKFIIPNLSEDYAGKTINYENDNFLYLRRISFVLLATQKKAPLPICHFVADFGEIDDPTNKSADDISKVEECTSEYALQQPFWDIFIHEVSFCKGSPDGDCAESVRTNVLTAASEEWEQELEVICSHELPVITHFKDGYQWEYNLTYLDKK